MFAKKYTKLCVLATSQVKLYWQNSEWFFSYKNDYWHSSCVLHLTKNTPGSLLVQDSNLDEEAASCNEMFTPIDDTEHLQHPWSSRSSDTATLSSLADVVTL